ncbi:MAG TPA: DUF2007 domain-containing protein [Candidatus Angelobacter sp.]|nr:DUF2007 domain-containing protein [Candidatus Angelobacter sp.]
MATGSHYDPELVTVFDTQQESEALIIHGLLDSAGIESLILNREAPQDVLPGVGGVVIRVSASEADDARRIIAEYKSTAPEGEAGEEA